jgi:toluene monooxygenase electron transfer component
MSIQPPPENAPALPSATSLVRVVNGDAFSCAREDTFLSGGLRAGIGLPHECLSGGCGKCYFDLVEGQVEVLWEEAPGLSPKARLRGRRLACQTRPRGECVIRISPAPAFLPPIAPVRRRAVILARRIIAPGMAEITLGTASAAEFFPGQFCLLGFADVRGTRAYSMSNLPNRDGSWQFLIRRVPGGIGTQWLFDIANVGDDVELDGPYGNAYLRPEIPRDIICIAGGSGLSPILSIARAAVRDPLLKGRHIAAFYGGRAPADICVTQFWNDDPLLSSGAELHTAISDADAEGASAWVGHRGFIHEVVDAVARERMKDCEFYICGPARMVEAVQDLIVTQGVPRQRLHFDSFY